MGEPVGVGREGFVETVVEVLVVREDDVAADIVQLIGLVGVGWLELEIGEGDVRSLLGLCLLMRGRLVWSLSRGLATRDRSGVWIVNKGWKGWMRVR